MLEPRAWVTEFLFELKGLNRSVLLVQGLEMAVQKFGMRLELFGTEKQKKQIALTAAKHGLRVEFTDQRLQQAYQFALQSPSRDRTRAYA